MVPAAAPPQHAPKIGDGLGTGIVRITTNRKRINHATSMVLNTKPEVDTSEEEHVFPPYHEQISKVSNNNVNKSSVADRSRKQSIVGGEGRRRLEQTNSFVITGTDSRNKR